MNTYSYLLDETNAAIPTSASDHSHPLPVNELAILYTTIVVHYTVCYGAHLTLLLCHSVLLPLTSEVNTLLRGTSMLVVGVVQCRPEANFDSGCVAAYDLRVEMRTKD